MGDIKVHLGSMPEPKSSYNFVCKCCDFKCSRQSQYDRHLYTRKHIDAYNGYKIDDISTKKVPKSSTCVCICGTTSGVTYPGLLFPNM